MRLIDADKVAEAIEWLDIIDFALWHDVQECIDKVPTMDVEPIKHGYWTNISISVTGSSSAECSLCGTVVHDNFADVNRINYCPNCGAKMDAVEEDIKTNTVTVINTGDAMSTQAYIREE